SREPRPGHLCILSLHQSNRPAWLKKRVCQIGSIYTHYADKRSQGCYMEERPWIPCNVMIEGCIASASTMYGSAYDRFVAQHTTFRIGRCAGRSEEHTSELQSRENLVCRLLLEKKNQFARRLNRRHRSRGQALAAYLRSLPPTLISRSVYDTNSPSYSCHSITNTHTDPKSICRS